MKNILFIIIAGLFVMGGSVFADDVSIDSDGNVTTGVSNTYGNLEVTGESAEHAIIGTTSGTGAVGVIGWNTDNNYVGLLGASDAGAHGEDDSGNYGKLGTEFYGVYGNSPSGYAGYFEGDARVTGDLTVDGTFTGYTETDPLFSGWDKSTGISITESQISDLNHFTNLNEIDPVFTGSPAYGITSNLISNWNAAYAWGDHSAAGYDTTNDPWTGMGNVYITSGSVGMGTTTPSSRLEIAGNGFPLSFLTFNGTGGTNDTGLRFNTNGGVRWHFFNQGSTDLLTLRRESNYGSPVIAADYTSGNVGIGTSSPSQKLTVDGTIHSTSGGIKFPDGTIQTTAAAPSWHQTLPASERFVLVMNNLEAVLDKETGLVWEKSPSTFTFNWHGAISYCIGRVIGGRSGWHLPTIEQLRTIADSSQSSPALPSGHPFVNVQSSDYWSSTTLAGTSTVARNVTFSTGEAVTGTKISEYFHAWCVRGGQSHDGY